MRQPILASHCNSKVQHFFFKWALKNSIHTPVGREERDHGQVDQLQLKEAFVEDKAGKVFGFLLGFPMLITEFIGNKSL